MTEVEQLRKDYEHMKHRRAEAEQYLYEERATVSRLMASIKFLSKEFEELERTFNDHCDGHRDNE
jgi:phage host-nuclease inhibitor protein Gam